LFVIALHRAPHCQALALSLGALTLRLVLVLAPAACQVRGRKVDRDFLVQLVKLLLEVLQLDRDLLLLCRGLLGRRSPQPGLLSTLVVPEVLDDFLFP